MIFFYSTHSSRWLKSRKVSETSAKFGTCISWKVYPKEIPSEFKRSSRIFEIDKIHNAQVTLEFDCRVNNQWIIT